MSKKNEIFNQLTKLKEERKEVDRKISKLEGKIRKKSEYNYKQMLETIASLISHLEGQQYVCDFRKDIFYPNKPKIIAKDKTRYTLQINVKDTYFIPGTCNEIVEIYNAPKEIKNKLYEFISNFFDYLFELRFEKSEINLNEALENYLEVIGEGGVIDYRDTRKKLIELEEEKRIRRKFEDSCMVDLKSMFAAMAHIAKNYDKIGGRVETVVENGDKFEEIIIGDSSYKKIIAVEEWPEPDDYGCSWYEEVPDAKEVNFFKIKTAFGKEKAKYLEYFFKELEKKFSNNCTFLDKNVIHEVLIEVSNKAKSN